MSQLDKYQEQALCLAGVVQSSILVDHIAHDRSYKDEDFITCIKTLFVLNCANPETVYGNRSALQLGLQSLQCIAENKIPDELDEAYRYTLNLLILERKLSKDMNMQGIIRDRLKITVKQAQQTSPSHDVVLTSLANIYQSTLSTLPYRIQIVGEKDCLRDKDKTTKMRALLFAGIRSAILWHQLGGRRRHLVFNRGRVLKAVGLLMAKPK